MSQKSVSLTSLVNDVATQDNPLSVLRSFLQTQKRLEEAREIDKMRFVGYVLEIGYDKAKIITSDPYKLAVGGIPRGSFLIMVPNDFGNLPLHFTLLRVTDVSETPLSHHVQQTYFELHKKSMPELDIWTQNELQWGALDCDVLGMFYPDPDDSSRLSFSGDVNNVVSAHKYKVFAPDEALLELIVNGTVASEHRFELGTLRTMECRLGEGTSSKIPVYISIKDFKGRRTAMFGKTRLGKSNVVKLLAKAMIESTRNDNSVGQLIFDINGEYANDNDKDGNKSIRSVYEDRTQVYALVKRPKTPSKPLKINFYEQPDSTIEILASFLEEDGKTSNYIRSFAGTELPPIETLNELPVNKKVRAIRKIQYYWAILYQAGFPYNEKRLKGLGLVSPIAKHFNPHFSSDLREAAYRSLKLDIPEHPKNLQQLVDELRVIVDFKRKNPDHKCFRKKDDEPYFDPHEEALLNFLFPTSGSGPSLLRPYIAYHDENAGDFVNEILNLLDQGKTVILDLGNATDKIRQYFSDMLSRAVFAHQEKKFVSNELKDHYIQLYFEEAHNLFPPNEKDLTGVYARFAKEGAKFNIGMVYSTQSPSTINKELLVQTENFFVGHLSSIDEAKALSRVQVSFVGIENDILRSRTPGYMRMLTMSHRFVIPVQTKRFEAVSNTVITND